MFKTLINAFKDPGVRKKIIWTLVLLLVYRIGCFVPIPGISASAISNALGTGAGLAGSSTLLGVMSAVTGGSLSQGTLLALGIVPYINASIIIQLLTMVIPAFERWSKEGEEGKKKLSSATRIGAMILAVVQAVGIVVAYNAEGSISNDFFGSTELTCVVVGIIMVGGSAFAMWLGERITELGIGNGTSLIIFIGILSTAGVALKDAVIFAANPETAYYWWTIVLFLALVLVIFGVIVWMDLSERRIPVQYAKQVKGNKMYGGQNTHIPIRLNSSGVLPMIFASALIMFPQMIAQLIWGNCGFVQFWSTQAGNIVYTVVTALLIVFFAFFYAQVQFNPDDIARNIQQYGGTIVGVRPGKNTAVYLKRINNRIVLFGALFLALLSFVPSLLFSFVGGGQIGLTSAFTATGMLIVVSVALEFNKQLESQLMMKHYKGFLK